jgi:hypothetical protein
MLFQFLDNLRTKPRQTRERVAFLTALSFTLIIAGVWTLTLPARFTEQSGVVSTGTTPFAGVWNGFREQFGSLKEQASAITSAIDTSTSTATSTELATSSDMIDLNELLSSTTIDTTPKPVILIGTTSATGTRE